MNERYLTKKGRQKFVDRVGNHKISTAVETIRDLLVSESKKISIINWITVSGTRDEAMSRNAN